MRVLSFFILLALVAACMGTSMENVPPATSALVPTVLATKTRAVSPTPLPSATPTATPTLAPTAVVTTPSSKVSTGKVKFQLGSIPDYPFELQTYVVNSDGTGLVNLNNGLGTDSSASTWSPDGQWIALSLDSSRQIHVVRPDGTQLRQVTNLERGASWPTWSADGQRIKFVAREGLPDDIDYGHFYIDYFEINVDGSGLQFLERYDLLSDPTATPMPPTTIMEINNGFYRVDAQGKQFPLTLPPGLQEYHLHDVIPSPDGKRLACLLYPTYDPERQQSRFYELVVFGVDGTSAEWITTTSPFYSSPLYLGEILVWSPDSAQLAYVTEGASDPTSIETPKLYVIGADGSGETVLWQNSPGTEGDVLTPLYVAWQPVP